MRNGEAGFGDSRPLITLCLSIEPRDCEGGELDRGPSVIDKMVELSRTRPGLMDRRLSLREVWGTFKSEEPMPSPLTLGFDG